MLRVSTEFLFVLVVLLPPLTFGDLEEADVSMELITDSSPCSATCGLGLKTQTLCRMKAVEEDVRTEEAAIVSEACRVRSVQCLQSWQCGLQTLTATAGQRVEIDCLGEVMKTKGRFSWRVTWRHTRGIITSDDSLFAHWKTLYLDRVILDPVREEDAGTYRCEVQDASYRRVKRAYWGIRVLPVGVVNLDYESSLSQWDQPGKQHKQTSLRVHHMVVLSVGIAVVVVLALLGLCLCYRGGGSRKGSG
ncbi:transmembrane protein 81 [Gouania willdenowi]|uniref:transmembrane protein 81 n=1 Tax=Gouania willdenowi TaxID=441366 RepID=UPI0010552CE6|nr:transmembrane protein 81 [Gouania willdenowi]